MTSRQAARHLELACKRVKNQRAECKKDGKSEEIRLDLGAVKFRVLDTGSN